MRGHRMARLCFLVLLVAAMVQHSRAGYSIESAGLKIIFPPDNKKSISMAMADFGQPRYGGSLM